MGRIMAFKIYVIVIALLMLPSISAYQQGYLVFDTKGWEIFEQVSSRQAFAKGDLFLEIRATQGSLIDNEEFAREIEGKVESSANYTNVQEVVIANKETFYIFSVVPYNDHSYLATMTGPKLQMNDGKTAMQAIYKTFSFSSTPEVVEAPWEKEPVPPKRLSFLVTHPIPWDWIILFLILGGIGWLIVRKVKKRRHKHVAHEEQKK